MGDYYVLDEDNNVVETSDVRVLGEFLRKDDARRVARDKVGDFDVSTVFLGVDHRYGDLGPPILFETMVFDKDGVDVYIDRYCTWDEALKGHQGAVQKVREGELCV